MSPSMLEVKAGAHCGDCGREKYGELVLVSGRRLSSPTSPLMALLTTFGPSWGCSKETCGGLFFSAWLGVSVDPPRRLPPAANYLFFYDPCAAVKDR